MDQPLRTADPHISENAWDKNKWDNLREFSQHHSRAKGCLHNGWIVEHCRFLFHSCHNTVPLMSKQCYVRNRTLLLVSSCVNYPAVLLVGHIDCQFCSDPCRCAKIDALPSALI